MKSLAVIAQGPDTEASFSAFDAVEAIHKLKCNENHADKELSTNAVKHIISNGLN